MEAIQDFAYMRPRTLVLHSDVEQLTTPFKYRRFRCKCCNLEWNEHTAHISIVDDKTKVNPLRLPIVNCKDLL